MYLFVLFENEITRDHGAEFQIRLQSKLQQQQNNTTRNKSTLKTHQIY